MLDLWGRPMRQAEDRAICLKSTRTELIGTGQDFIGRNQNPEANPDQMVNHLPPMRPQCPNWYVLQVCHRPHQLRVNRLSMTRRSLGQYRI